MGGLEAKIADCRGKLEALFILKSTRKERMEKVIKVSQKLDRLLVKQSDRTSKM